MAQNKTLDVTCAESVLDFLNEGCICSLTVYNTLQAFPETTIPLLLKQGKRPSLATLNPNTNCMHFKLTKIF